MSGDVHVQFSERLRVNPPWSTQPYLKVKGRWVYLYQAVDKEGDTVDFMLSEKRDEPSARAFFEKAIGSSGMDKSGANKAGIDAINLQLALLFMINGLFLQINVRQVKYLNNIVEQDHRFIKKNTKLMRGFKAFHSADATLSGIELHHMLRKGQHIQSGKQTIFEQFYKLAENNSAFRFEKNLRENHIWYPFDSFIQFEVIFLR